MGTVVARRCLPSGRIVPSRILSPQGCMSMNIERLIRRPAGKTKKEPRVSRTHAPAGLSTVDWQRALRRQFGQEQAFGVENLGDEAFFSEFRVSNPASR